MIPCGAPALVAGRGFRRRGWFVLAFAMAALLGAPAFTPTARATAVAQQDFASAEQAVDALIAALRADDQTRLKGILGPSGRKLIHSGDHVADREARLRLINAYDSAH